MSNPRKRERKSTATHSPSRAILRRLAVLAGLLTLWPSGADAIPIVSVTGTGQQPTGFFIGSGPSGEQILAVSWNQTESYTDVAITALLSGFFRGVAHLTMALGPGTTTAEEVAAGEFLVQLDTADRDDVLLLSGLVLGPGTYFLTLDPADESGGNWWLEDHIIVLDTGVSLNGSVRSNNADIDTLFAPASTFTSVANGLPFSYTVIGERAATTIPEPGTGLLFAVALIGLGLMMRQRQENPILPAAGGERLLA